MSRAAIVSLVATAAIVSACGGEPTCEDQDQLYQQAVPGKRIETLDGMDALPADKELTIPEASPGAPPPPGKCMDAPPTMNTSRGKASNEDE